MLAYANWKFLSSTTLYYQHVESLSTAIKAYRTGFVAALATERMWEIALLAVSSTVYRLWASRWPTLRHSFLHRLWWWPEQKAPVLFAIVNQHNTQFTKNRYSICICKTKCRKTTIKPRLTHFTQVKQRKRNRAKNIVATQVSKVIQYTHILFVIHFRSKRVNQELLIKPFKFQWI